MALDIGNTDGTTNINGTTDSTTNGTTDSTINGTTDAILNGNTDIGQISNITSPSVLNQTDKTSGNTLELNMDKYAVLFKDIIYSLLQISVTIFLLIAILNISKEDANALYPTNLNDPYYTTQTCDLNNIKPGETEFCDPFKQEPAKIPINPGLKPGHSYFSNIFRNYAENMGYVTGDSFSMLLLWLSYLAFSCDHFLMTWLNGAHSLAQLFDKSNKIIAGIILIIIASVITHYSMIYVNPFLTKLFFPKKTTNNPHNFFVTTGSQIVISFICVVILILAFFIVPSTIYYIVALVSILFKNLSIQINILSIFSLYLCIKSLHLFIVFMNKRFSKTAQDEDIVNAQQRAAAERHRRDPNSVKCQPNQVYTQGGLGNSCTNCPSNTADPKDSNIIPVSDGICGIVNDDIKSQKQCNKSAKKGGGGFWINNQCVINPDAENDDPPLNVVPKTFKAVTQGKNKVTYWLSM